MELKPAAVADRTKAALYLDPPSHHFLKDRLFDASSAPRHGDNILAPYIAIRTALESKGIAVHTADLLPPPGGDTRLFYASVGRIPDLAALAARGDVTLSAFFAMECPIVEPTLYRALPEVERHVRRIYTFCDAEQLLPFTRTRIQSTRFTWPQCAPGIDDEAWSRTDRKFLAMINANKLPASYDRELYTERLRAVAYFHQFREIDLFGRGWDKAPMWLGRTRVPYTFRRMRIALWEARQRLLPDPVYAAVAAASRGPIDSKAETLGGYKFAICFENMILQSWITEKVVDCFRAGCVPVYLGAPDVEDWIPPETFIDMRRFRDFAELRRYLHEMPPGELQRHREAARDFVTTTAFERFLPEAYAALFVNAVREDLQTGT